jgi:hypothetical protein
LYEEGGQDQDNYGSGGGGGGSGNDSEMQNEQDTNQELEIDSQPQQDNDADIVEEGSGQSAENMESQPGTGGASASTHVDDINRDQQQYIETGESQQLILEEDIQPAAVPQQQLQQQQRNQSVSTPTQVNQLQPVQPRSTIISLNANRHLQTPSSTAVASSPSLLGQQPAGLARQGYGAITPGNPAQTGKRLSFYFFEVFFYKF